MKLNPEQKEILHWALELASNEAYHLKNRGDKPIHCGLSGLGDWEKIQKVIFSLKGAQK